MPGRTRPANSTLGRTAGRGPPTPRRAGRGPLAPRLAGRGQPTYGEDNDDSVSLPKVHILVATKSAKAGINRKYLEFGKMSVFLNNFYKVVQRLERVDRKETAKPGDNTYTIHVDFHSYLSLYVHIMSCDSAGQRRIQLTQRHEVLTVLLLPEICYHTITERTFEWTTDVGKTGCKHYCSKCRGNVKKFTKRLNKEGLQSLLTTEVQGAADKVPVREFLKAMKRERKTIFHRDDVLALRNQSQIHAMCLQMIGGGLLALKAIDATKVGHHGQAERRAPVCGVSQRQVCQGWKHDVGTSVHEI